MFGMVTLNLETIFGEGKDRKSQAVQANKGECAPEQENE
jgi:hypothetical protein